MLVSPCKDCQNRHPHCHSECDPYKAYDEDRKLINLTRRAENLHNGYFDKMSEKRQKKRGK